jgi:hypothetical protein
MARVLASSLRSSSPRCGCCGQRLRDNTTDFGNGLMLRTTERGVEFRVIQAPDGHWPGTAWTPGISREELAAFLSGEPPLSKPPEDAVAPHCRWVP